MRTNIHDLRKFGHCWSFLSIIITALAGFLAIEGSELSVMVLMCVGAQLPFLVSSYLLERGGYGFRPGNMDDHWYAYVLMYKYADPVDEVNAFLREQGATPLF